MSGTWDHPDFDDVRFSIEDVVAAPLCNHPDCTRLATFLVDYTMRHPDCTYQYGCGYCGEHLPPKARTYLGEAPT